MKKILFFLLFVSTVITAQTADDLFQKANALYQENKFEEAIKMYEKIETKGVTSSALYYNIANCYYKLNKVAPTIYNYEKALKINPLNEDALNNLVFAKRLTIDAIEEVPKSFFQKLNKNYLQKLSYNEWAIVIVSFAFLAGILFLCFHFSNTPSIKRLFFTTSVISFIALIATVFITYNQYNLEKNTVEAIVFAEAVEVKSEPLESASEAFTLHEGTKVTVLDTVDEWTKIRLLDGKVGWMVSNNIRILSLE